MSSRARAVFLGRPPGSFLLTKWITWVFSGAVPSEAGGAAVCRRATTLSRSCARRCAFIPTFTIAERARRMVSGLVAFSMNMAAAPAGRKLFLPILRSRLRMAMVTSPKSIFTGQGDRHLWHTVQWSATSSNSCQCLMLTPRRVCSSYKKASTSREVAKILSRGLYSRLARGTWVAQTGLHLPQRRQSFTLSAMAPMSLCCMIKDSCPIKPKLGV